MYLFLTEKEIEITKYAILIKISYKNTVKIIKHNASMSMYRYKNQLALTSRFLLLLIIHYDYFHNFTKASKIGS